MPMGHHVVEGWNRQTIIDAVVLLREAPWSSKAVEEQHGSMALMHRQHRELDRPHLCLRSYIHAGRYLIASDDSLLARQTARLVRSLQRKVPQRASGINLFCSDAVAAARRHMGPLAKVSFKDSQAVVSRAATTFRDMPLEAQDAYAAHAKARGVARQGEIASEINFLRDQQALIDGAARARH